jgi:hypothetical protein
MDEYPNSSEAIEATQQWHPEKPQSRKDVEEKELAKITSSIGVVQDVIDWLKVNADLYATVDSLNVNESTPDFDAKLAILLSKNMRSAFQSKAAEFKSKFAKYLKEEKPKA